MLPRSTPRGQALHWTPNQYGDHRADVGPWRLTVLPSGAVYVDQVEQTEQGRRAVEFVGRFTSPERALEATRA